MHSSHPSPSANRDLILLHKLSFTSTAGSSLWGKKDTPQPILVSASVPFSIRLAGAADHLPHSIHYGNFARTIERVCTAGSGFTSMERMAEDAASAALAEFPEMAEVNLEVQKPKALLHAKCAGIRIQRKRDKLAVTSPDVIFIQGLELSTIIGIHPWERQHKQRVRISLTLEIGRWDSLNSEEFDYQALVSRVSDEVLESSYQTVEALVSSVARVCLSAAPSITQVTAGVAKPSALMIAEAPEIRITRSREDFPELTSRGLIPAPSSNTVAALAFGSNVGDRFENIERALHLLEGDGTTKVVDTSFLYESKAMYVEDQRDFINGACLITTSCAPQELLELLKSVEGESGRTPTFRNGPRVVDLDLIFYGSEEFESSPDIPEDRKLTVPHMRVHEREFVLRPLADMIPNFIHPRLGLPIHTMLSLISPTATLRRVIPFRGFQTESPEQECLYWTWGSRTFLMAIINSTPDSFSDGGDHNTVDSAIKSINSFGLPDGSSMADILDIGGYSTRPGAAAVAPEEEINRTVPLIQALTEKKYKTPISIDTFRASVARAALAVGASVVNDVYGLTRDPEILNVVREAGCPIVIMHSRGDAGQDKDYKSCGGVIPGVSQELSAKVQRALDAGIRRWNIIVDPGVGFSKTVEDNAALIRGLGEVTKPIESHPTHTLKPSSLSLSNMPSLVGASRKSFLGKLVSGRAESEVLPKDRTAATIAAHTSAIAAGADILRVHDVKEGWDGIQVADLIWRTSHI